MTQCLQLRLATIVCMIAVILGGQKSNCTKEERDDDAKFNWDVKSNEHPCNIHRISGDMVESIGPLYPYPLVIYPSGGRRNSNFSRLTTVENLASNFVPNFNVTLSGSDSLSSHRREIPLHQYLDEILHANGVGETLPDQLGNQSWYLFGETFTDDWAKFLRSYEIPRCNSCTREQVALSFGIGNAGSGVQWHIHGPGFSETIHGRKHWVLYPPHQRPTYNLDYASRHWMEHEYGRLENWTGVDVEEERNSHAKYMTNSGKSGPPFDILTKNQERGPSGKKPFECTIHPGEMIYFPDQWHHATINLDEYTCFVSSFL
mmetsp:Transcript_21711/g.51146  ORF Transcript_21711/g.51146 Transcript_21711/m.51146 type:complete len:317 (-) Transcript_21711:147-1097(-)